MYKYLIMLVLDFLGCFIILGNILSLLLLEYTYVNPVKYLLVCVRPLLLWCLCVCMFVSLCVVSPSSCLSSLSDPELVFFCLLLPSVLVADFADCCRLSAE